MRYAADQAADQAQYDARLVSRALGGAVIPDTGHQPDNGKGQSEPRNDKAEGGVTGWVISRVTHKVYDRTRRVLA